jgi:hypothetical protein
MAASAWLAKAGRSADALTIIRRTVAEARSHTRERDLAHLLLEYGRQLLLLNRADEALTVVREVGALTWRGPSADNEWRCLLICVLGLAGRYDEMRQHVARGLAVGDALARLGISNRTRYIALLSLVVQCFSAAGLADASQRADAMMLAQRRVMRRKFARRLWFLRGVLTVLTLGRDPGLRAAGADVDPEAEDMRRLREAGDPRALADGLAALAQRRWAEGRRTPAREAQAEAVEVTRRLFWAGGMGSRLLLVERLVCYAGWADADGCLIEGQLARAEVATLSGQDGSS